MVVFVSGRRPRSIVSHVVRAHYNNCGNDPVLVTIPNAMTLRYKPTCHDKLVVVVQCWVQPTHMRARTHANAHLYNQTSSHMHGLEIFAL